MHALLKKLEGGDRRSIGRVGEVVEDVLNDSSLFEILIDGLFMDDPLIRMRAADAIEKITADFPEYLQPFKQRLIYLSGQTAQQEVKWHLSQILPRLPLESKDKEIVIKNLFSYLNDQSKIVVTFAMQALADLTIKEPDITARVTRAIETLTQTGSPAIRSRGKKLLTQLKNPSDKNRRAKTVEK